MLVVQRLCTFRYDDNSWTHPDSAASDLESLKKLVNGRVDIIPMNRIVANDLINKNFTDQKDDFRYMKNPILSKEMGVFTGKENPEGDRLLSAFAKGMAKIRATGEYDNILIRNGYDFLVVEDDSASEIVGNDYSHLGTITFATGEWAPYVSEGLSNQGFTAEIIQRAFENVGVKSEFKYYSWTRTLEEIGSHNAFGTFPWGYTEERVGQFKFTAPVTISETKLMFRTDNSSIPTTFNQLSDLSRFKFGGAEEYSYLVELDKAGISADLSNSETDAIKKLYNKRFDLLPIEPLVAMEFVKK